MLVGGGILGLAVARELLLRRPASKVVVLEKEDGVGVHQTGHSSGVIHSGIYYAPGSLKARLCVEGSRMLYDYCDERRIPYERCGKLVVAVDAADTRRLEELYARGRANGVPGLAWVGPGRLRELEPHASGVAALHSPATGIVDFRAVALELAREIRSLGATIRTSILVTGVRRRGAATVVETPAGSFMGRLLITCAGLYSDRLAAMTGGPANPKIVPFRGSYYELHGDARRLVRGLVYPVPDPAFPFLGVHFTKRISGDVWAGPNAVLAFAREGYRLGHVCPSELWESITYQGFQRLAQRHWRSGAREVWGELSKRAFASALRRLVPDISVNHLGARHAGVRAQAVFEDGRLLDDFWLDEAPGVVHVRNAPSPGATSSLALARTIVAMVEPALAR